MMVLFGSLDFIELIILSKSRFFTLFRTYLIVVSCSDPITVTEGLLYILSEKNKSNSFFLDTTILKQKNLHIRIKYLFLNYFRFEEAQLQHPLIFWISFSFQENTPEMVSSDASFKGFLLRNLPCLLIEESNPFMCSQGWNKVPSCSFQATFFIHHNLNCLF